MMPRITRADLQRVRAGAAVVQETLGMLATLEAVAELEEADLEAVLDAVLQHAAVAEAMLDAGRWPLQPLANLVRTLRDAATEIGLPAAQLAEHETDLVRLRDALAQPGARD
jgi:hypothetical protein